MNLSISTTCTGHAQVQQRKQKQTHRDIGPALPMQLQVHPDFPFHLTNVVLQAIRLEEGGEGAPDPLMIITSEFQEASISKDHPHRISLLVAQFGASSREQKPVGSLTVNEDSGVTKQAELRHGTVSLSSIRYPFFSSVSPHSPQKAKALADEWYS